MTSRRLAGNLHIAMSHQIRTYTELRRKIHDDLRLQHPEWVQPGGDSPICDSYDARLMELIDALTRAEVRTCAGTADDIVAACHPAIKNDSGAILRCVDSPGYVRVCACSRVIAEAQR
jgi:hypothetical protein